MTTTAPFPRSAARTEDVLDGQGAALRELMATGDLDLPLPGGGRTWTRWQALARFGAQDLVLGRLAEGHADAVAILAEAGRPHPTGRLLGVWASANEGTGLAAERVDGGWRLSGTLRFASGARVLDEVLVTVRTPSGPRLALVEVGRLHPVPGTWAAVGMADSDSLDVEAHGVRVEDDDLVAGPRWYAERPGLWVGGIGVAAVWWGGATGVLDGLTAGLARSPEPGPHRLAHLGGAWSAVERGRAVLHDAARAVDAAPGGDHARLALHARHTVEQVVAEVVERSGRATGAAPLCRDGDHARRIADLAVFVRQQHAERDLEALGAAVVAGAVVLEGARVTGTAAR